MRDRLLGQVEHLAPPEDVAVGGRQLPQRRQDELDLGDVLRAVRGHTDREVVVGHRDLGAGATVEVDAGVLDGREEVGPEVLDRTAAARKEAEDLRKDSLTRSSAWVSPAIRRAYLTASSTWRE